MGWNIGALVACHVRSFVISCTSLPSFKGARCSSVVRAFAHGVMGRRIEPSWGGPIELFLVPASDPMTGVTKAVVCVILSVG